MLLSSPQTVPVVVEALERPYTRAQDASFAETTRLLGAAMREALEALPPS
jgi:hypothetical protein